MSKPATPRAPPTFAALVQSFFTEHLTQQRAMSPRVMSAAIRGPRAPDVPGSFRSFLRMPPTSSRDVAQAR